MGKAEIWNSSTSRQLDISQASAVIFHISQAMWRRKIIKMLNLGKEIENDKKWNEKKPGPCMNVFLNFDPYTTLDHLRNINEKIRQKLRRHTSHSLMQLPAK